MINTKCKECMFADTNNETSCAKNIISKIESIKTITKDSDNFNIIENYACRYGFSKQIYDQYKNRWDPNDFESRLLDNSKVRYYLLLDCNEEDLNFDSIVKHIPGLSIQPKAISFMFRNINYRPFNMEYQNFLLENYKDIHWKAHNFLENMSLEYSIDHILSTNAKNNNTSIFLVYNAKDLMSLDNDIQTINNNIVLYQYPMIAMIDNNNNSLYRLAMSFENYKVAKSLGANLIPVLTQETSIIHY